MRIQTVHPERRALMLETHHQMEYCARLYEKLGFKYIIGWRDVQGYGLSVTKFAEWQSADGRAYIDLWWP